GARDDRPRCRRERAHARVDGAGPDGLARAPRPRHAAAPGAQQTARDAPVCRLDARHPGNVLPGNRPQAAPAGGHRQVADQSGPDRAGASRQEARSLSMNVKTEQAGQVSIVRVGETRLMYPILSDFSAIVSDLVAAGHNKILIDLAPVTYVDSATIGCLMDLYRQVQAAG